MYTDNKLWIAQSDKPLYLLPKMANRHGLIAGATGTGKTVTMKVMAESFSDMGVPVFFADVKGDLSGMLVPGSMSEGLRKRIARFGFEDLDFKSYPTCFWDIFGEKGHPVRVTVSDMGPVFLARMLGLTEIQAGVLNVVFKIADDNELPILDLKDLRAILQFVGDNRAEFTTIYGNVSTASIGAIQRALLTFEQEGAADFFGEPQLDITDWMRTDEDGRGYINILSSQKLINSPLVYGTFLLWMLSELYEQLPEVGDAEKPKMVFFFDEAHLVFSGAQKTLIQKIVQTVKLIRSKGVGVYFISQSPSDIPNDVLAQLSNRVQHALRAYTPAEEKAIKAAAKAFRVNPAFNTETALKELGVGEALVSFLDEDGIPEIVERAYILPPLSRMGEADAFEVDYAVKNSAFEIKYRESIDSESAYEILMQANELIEQQRAEEAARIEAEKQAAKEAAAAEKQAAKEAAAAEKAAAKAAALAAKAAQKEAEAKKKVVEKAVTNAANSVVNSVSTNVINTIAGGKKASASTIAKRAASTALKSVARSGSNAILRGLFGNKK